MLSGIQDDEEDDVDHDLSTGFWEEFFLLRPDSHGLKRILDSMSPDGLLHVQSHSQQLFLGAIQRMKQSRAPADENALDVCRL